MSSQRSEFATLLAAALALTVAACASPARAITATRTATPAHTPGPSTIFGRVATTGLEAGCTGGRPGVTVLLEPTSRSTITSASGEFVFEDVPSGQYRFHVEPDCEPIPCYAPGPYDHFRDTTIALCYEDCPGTLTVEPGFGRAGSVVDVSGYCYTGLAGHDVAIYIDDRPVAETSVDSMGVYEVSFIVPHLDPNHSHRVRAIVGGDELALGYFSIRAGPEPCVGDCDGSFAVTVDELIRGVRGALNGSAPDDCAAIDNTEDGTVTVAELVAAVGRALAGCHAADLVATNTRTSRCVAGCSDVAGTRLFIEVCIANRGDLDAPAFNVEHRGGVPNAFASVIGLAAGDETCVELPFARDATVVVDVYDAVAERDEMNNTLPIAIGTACDVVGPPCTPTPVPSPTPT